MGSHRAGMLPVGVRRRGYSDLRQGIVTARLQRSFLSRIMDTISLARSGVLRRGGFSYALHRKTPQRGTVGLLRAVGPL